MFAADNSKGFIDSQIIILLYIQIKATHGITHAARVRGRSKASFYLFHSDLGILEVKGVHRTARCHPGTDIPLQHPWNTFRYPECRVGGRNWAKNKKKGVPKRKCEETALQKTIIFFSPWEKVIDFFNPVG